MFSTVITEEEKEEVEDEGRNAPMLFTACRSRNATGTCSADVTGAPVSACGLTVPLARGIAAQKNK